MDILEIENVIASKNKELLKQLMDEYQLELADGKLKPKNKEYAEGQRSFWNQRQQARKILLNSLYGALLNKAMKFYDKRIGQSTTLTGRNIVRHMNSKVNEEITGVYDYKGEAIRYADTDSVTSDTNIRSNLGNMTAEELFMLCAEQGISWEVEDKEYAVLDKLLVASYNGNELISSPINYVYRHKVSKPKWVISDEFGNEVIVTDDHSVMVERDGEIVEIKPRDITDTDILISLE